MAKLIKPKPKKMTKKEADALVEKAQANLCKSCLGKGYYSYFGGTHGKDEFTGKVVGDPLAIRYYPCKACAGGKGPLFDKPLDIKDTGSYCTICRTPKCEDGGKCKRWVNSHHWMYMCHNRNHHGAELRNAQLKEPFHRCIKATKKKPAVCFGLDTLPTIHTKDCVLAKPDTVSYTSRWVGNGEPLEKPKCKLTLLGAVVFVGVGMLIGALIW
jgi:hypothetical protein